MGVFAFSHSFLILGWNIENEQITFTFNNNIAKTVGLIWANVEGDFDMVRGFEGWDYNLLYILWFMHTVISMFVLVNLVVSIMGDSFNRV